ncbi:MAG: 3'-5' exonuclease [Treponema sp.]|jgi:DNA polymerase-3 subunit epsilon|nr:3'-5' exonuclease [Treponema sp.]
MNDFIAIDFETAMYAPNSAISIGLVKYRDYEVVDTFYSLIRPPKLYILPRFTDIHGLTIDDVKDAHNFKYIWENAVYDFLEDLPLVAHNASFDMGVLKAVLQWYDLPVPRLSYFCSCSLARKTWPGFRSYSLSALAKNFNIIYKAHNALDDAKTCGKLVQMSVEIFGKKKTLKAFLKTANTKMKIL